jgi:hypothetical protein
MVGNVYQQIIRDVVETSRVDFEEGGVDEGVLEELAMVSFRLFSNAHSSDQSVVVSVSFHHIAASISSSFHVVVIAFRSYLVVVCCLCGLFSLCSAAIATEIQEAGGRPSVYVCLLCSPGKFDSLRLR